MSASPPEFRRPAETIGALDSDVAARLTAIAGDVALVVDAQGVILDLAVSDPDLAKTGVEAWRDRNWVDTASSDSRDKVEAMLRETPPGGVGRWRLVNHPAPEAGSNGALVIRYMTVDAGGGKIFVIGRDQRSLATMQQRLLQAQQSMERDYMRLRQAESRYRLLFDLSSEAVVIVDAATSRVVEANPASRRLVGEDGDRSLGGDAFASLIDPDSRDAAAGVLAGAAGSSAPMPTTVRLAHGGRACTMTATLFRQDNATYTLVRLLPEAIDGVAAIDARQMLIDVLDRLPDAFVVTDESLDILAENASFLELAQFARREHVRGQSLTRFLGRAGIDLSLIVTHLKEHGSIRNFATVFRSQFDGKDDVEVSAVAVPDGEQPCYGFSIRSVGRRLREEPASPRDLPRSVEQLTELVGRVSLKEIVRESTDLIERLCIEAALAYTEDNRASAAEILGLSRQSLYSKLHRHGLGNLVSDG